MQGLVVMIKKSGQKVMPSISRSPTSVLGGYNATVAQTPAERLRQQADKLDLSAYTRVSMVNLTGDSARFLIEQNVRNLQTVSK